MHKSLYIAVILAILIFSCQSKDKKVSAIGVKHSGALRTIMSGNLQSVISLDSFSNKKNFYALGAVDHLKGEIQIFDSKPSNSFIMDSTLQIKDAYNLKAALLVYTEVETWNEFKIENILTKDDLENAISETAKSNGINLENPFPFLLEGKIKELDWHVINWKDGDTIHSHTKHKASGLNGNLKDEDVLIIGFYSSKHKAVFTHHTTNMHMHFKTDDNTVAGHIDDLILSEVITLKLPRQ
jgi:acetolactate decarboxylase